MNLTKIQSTVGLFIERHCFPTTVINALIRLLVWYLHTRPARQRHGVSFFFLLFFLFFSFFPFLSLSLSFSLFFSLLNDPLRRSLLESSRILSRSNTNNRLWHQIWWIWHHSTSNNIRKNVTGLTGTMYYDIFRSITRLQTFLLHSIHCKHQFRIFQYITFVYTN